MSNSTRHTLRNLFSALVVLAAGLFVVALASRGLVRAPDEAMAGVTTVNIGGAAMPVPPPRGAQQPPDQSGKPAAAKTRVLMVIDYGDGVQKHFVGIEHRAGMTAMDALVQAAAHARGVKVEHTGKGETAFVTKIDDLKNEGTGREKKNWQFFVNEKFSTAGPGATGVSAGDTVKWVYDTWRGK